MAKFDPFTTNAQDLQRMLQSREVTSVQIVERYLEQINRYNPKLRALVSIAPADNLHRIAKTLDDERREGRLRSPLHGVPIVLKVSLSYLVFDSLVADSQPGLLRYIFRSGHDDVCWRHGVCQCQSVKEFCHCREAGPLGPYNSCKIQYDSE